MKFSIKITAHAPIFEILDDSKITAQRPTRQSFPPGGGVGTKQRSTFSSRERERWREGVQAIGARATPGGRKAALIRDRMTKILQISHTHLKWPSSERAQRCMQPCDYHSAEVMATGRRCCAKNSQVLGLHAAVRQPQFQRSRSCINTDARWQIVILVSCHSRMSPARFVDGTV
jgi:hypothetical protein